VTPTNPWRLSVAPMMAWTDRHCRHLHRLITKRARLYTEMITTGALLHGDVAKHLAFDHATEQPVALQVGGNDPGELAHATRLAQQWGYDEINLNCGCPSDRVQRGAFGACLMASPALVADGVKAMLDVSNGLPVTVKHRLGIDRRDDYGFVRDFVGAVSDAGCRVFIVHARNAWLDGLSPKDNRDIPPLRYAEVVRLKQDFPHLTIVLNGGVVDNDAVAAHLSLVDGVMVGRSAYHSPLMMRSWDHRFLGAPEGHDTALTPADAVDTIELAMVDHMAQHVAPLNTWPSMARHMLGLRQGEPGARRWRQVWSDASLKQRDVRDVWRLARQQRLASAAAATLRIDSTI
jgi:tRNA-dihydrouridine synthase A